MISTRNVEENKALVSKYIKPGIGVYKIAFISKHKAPVGDTEGVILHMESKPMEELGGDTQKGEFTLYLTPKAMKYSLAQIVDIAAAFGISKEEMDKISADTTDDYIKQISPLLVGKFARFKFKGEEILSKTTGKKWLKASLPVYSFVEKLDEVNSKLKYEEARDITRLPVPDLEDVPQGSEDKTDDLPF